jgi:hypothetical protein
MKKATATSQGNIRFTVAPGATGGVEAALEWVGLIFVSNRTVTNSTLTSKLEQH